VQFGHGALELVGGLVQPLVPAAGEDHLLDLKLEAEVAQRRNLLSEAERQSLQGGTGCGFHGGVIGRFWGKVKLFPPNFPHEPHCRMHHFFHGPHCRMKLVK
jgi:hypothetical protein